MLSDQQRRTLWGDLFEVAVKRGCLALLNERGLLNGRDDELRKWRARRVSDLQRHLVEQTGAIDPSERAALKSSLEHLLVTGWGLGWTALREYLRRFPGSGLEVQALYCPLSLPDRRRDIAADPGERGAALWAALGLDRDPDPVWTGRGEPANVDMLLVLRSGERRHVLVLEFSLHAQPELEDYAEEEAHLGELERYVRRIESRGVFTRISAEIAGEEFAFSQALVSHLAALTTRDKPLYKLCQGSSYATRLLHHLERRGRPLTPATAQVMVVTNAGVEALAARFGDGPDPRAPLMTGLGVAYRQLAKGEEPEDGGAGLDREIAAVRAQIWRSLPDALRGPFQEAFVAPPTARGLSVTLREPISGFVNPAQALPRDEALGWVSDAPDEVAALLGGPTHDRVAAELERLSPGGGAVTLRDLHQAALIVSLESARPGRVSVVAAEGHPGIGKTTAVLEYLRRMGPDDGFLFVYSSPRIAINSEVTQKASHGVSGGAGEVLTITTTSRLIGSAPRWWALRNRQSAGNDRRFVDAAVVADGVLNLRPPRGSTLFLTTEQAEEIDEEFASSGLRKDTRDERLDDMRMQRTPGVLHTLARAARDALQANPELKRVVLTAAVQGFREAEGAASTVDRLSDLFQSRADEPRGLREREAFAARIPCVVVMVDEIAGDGAGAPYVHALARWLEGEFVRPFVNAGKLSPFTVVLVLSDASLANEVVLANYLGHAGGAPEKVIVSASHGPRPFRMAGGTLRIGDSVLPVLHVMADGFPARNLMTEYHVLLEQVTRPDRTDGSATNPRAAILEQHGKARLRAAAEEIFAALSTLPNDQQVILFAQDKRFLEDVRSLLVQPDLLEPEGVQIETRGQRLTDDDIGMLHSSVPEWTRRRLLQEKQRDSKRVFLMTSSGARGVSFPRTAVLIAFVPRFAVESGFMEIAQLIYRGRGKTRDPVTGEEWDGDTIDRRVVLLLQDFVLADEEIDDRQWLRRTIDLVSALVLLRATILTRITGDAGIRHQRAAVVPVGRIGTENAEVSLSRAVASFLHEGKVYLAGKSVPVYLRNVVDEAMGDVQAAFKELRWTGLLRDRSQRSIVQPEVLRALVSAISAPPTPLLGEARAASLPDEVYALGPVWMERWTDIPAEEAFPFQGAVDSGGAPLKRLVENCRDIARSRPGRDVPGPLRRAARDIRSILERPDALAGIGFVARRAVERNRVWVCIPIDCGRFCAVPPGEEHAGKAFKLAQPEHWLDALVRAAYANTEVTSHQPVLPHFDGRPFLVFSAQGDPTGLRRAFDDRYFMASSELNLLNTILFVDEAVGGPGLCA